MTKQLLIVRKVDRNLRLENKLGHLLAVTDGVTVKFFEPCTVEELARIAWIVQDYEFLSESVIEEVPE